MWESESDGRGGGRDLEPDKHDGLKTDGFERRDQSWYLLYFCFTHMKILYRFVSSDIPSDLLVKVGGVSFHLHKVVPFPLLLTCSLVCVVYLQQDSCGVRKFPMT
ncbi:hypothetical protein B296_00004154 [Ensete ventricosum]|uniref:Uncharacterized protein n=1 Tax=Ensete ventricosum TaxID=4639 RepID=A0A427B689_ENSVE|nr:hypothetical protein B296_00004154 [Ensete ventricosum]